LVGNYLVMSAIAIGGIIEVVRRIWKKVREYRKRQARRLLMRQRSSETQPGRPPAEPALSPTAGFVGLRGSINGPEVAVVSQPPELNGDEPEEDPARSIPVHSRPSMQVPAAMGRAGQQHSQQQHTYQHLQEPEPGPVAFSLSHTLRSMAVSLADNLQPSDSDEDDEEDDDSSQTDEGPEAMRRRSPTVRPRPLLAPGAGDDLSERLLSQSARAEDTSAAGGLSSPVHAAAAPRSGAGGGAGMGALRQSLIQAGLSASPQAASSVPDLDERPLPPLPTVAGARS
jgi:hypothetical protein